MKQVIKLNYLENLRYSDVDSETDPDRAHIESSDPWNYQPIHPVGCQNTVASLAIENQLASFSSVSVPPAQRELRKLASALRFKKALSLRVSTINATGKGPTTFLMPWAATLLWKLIPDANYPPWERITCLCGAVFIKQESSQQNIFSVIITILKY